MHRSKEGVFKSQGRLSPAHFHDYIKFGYLRGRCIGYHRQVEAKMQKGDACKSLNVRNDLDRASA